MGQEAHVVPHKLEVQAQLQSVSRMNNGIRQLLPSFLQKQRELLPSKIMEISQEIK